MSRHGGGRLGALTQGASAFAIRPGAGGRFEAVPFQIPPQEAARDRGVLQWLFAAHRIGRQMTIQRPSVAWRPPRPNKGASALEALIEERREGR